jgi:hypothetical protein
VSAKVIQQHAPEGNSEQQRHPGKRDTYDPDGSIAQRGERFLGLLKQIVPPSVLIKNKNYDNEGHVPFPAICDGLQWIYSRPKTGSNEGTKLSP